MENLNFDDLFNQDSFEEKLELEKNVLAFGFLSKIEQLYEEHQMNRNQFAKEINVSPSYLTQLFRGNKTPNLEILAKMGLYFNIAFEPKLRLLDTQKEELKNKKEIEIIFCNSNKEKRKPCVIKDIHRNKVYSHVECK